MAIQKMKKKDKLVMKQKKKTVIKKDSAQDTANATKN